MSVTRMEPSMPKMPACVCVCAIILVMCVLTLNAVDQAVIRGLECGSTDLT